MERTPSPPRRVRTPPAPHHGAKYDNYEPFSPRRSSRVAAQHEQTPRKQTSTRTANHTLSPPSSPISPAKLRSPRSTRRTQPDSDSDTFAPTPARRLLTAMAPRGMLPTPAKTPRKRALHTEESLRPTARVLFANRPSTVEDAMPTPRKAHKSIKSALAMDSFEEHMGTASTKMAVYVDSKERVPDREDEENNPFLSRKGKGKAKASPKKPRKMDEKTVQIFEAAARDEGIVYTHRGKTIFRQFEDVPHDADVGRSSEDELYHKADAGGSRRLTRSAIKPKLLFKEEIERLKRENGEEDDEEATTDIELPIATPSRSIRHGREVTPTATQDRTPPPTKTVKRQMSFESWSRVKSSARATSSTRAGAKRSGPPLENEADKRARSEQSSPTMSIDGF